MNTTKIITAAVSLLIAAASVAQTVTPVVTERQANETARTAEGVKSGEGGIAKLRAEQRARRAEKRMAQADGAVAANERTKLAQGQKAAGGDIHKQKDDAQKRQ